MKTQWKTTLGMLLVGTALAGCWEEEADLIQLRTIDMPAPEAETVDAGVPEAEPAPERQVAQADAPVVVDPDDPVPMTESPGDETGMEVVPDEPVAPVDEDAEGPSSALERATTDVGAASNAATDEAVQAIDAGEAPAIAAQDEAGEAAEITGSVGAASPDLNDEAMLTVLSPEGYDPERVRLLVEQRAEIEDVERALILQELAEAQDDPAELAAILERIRVILGVNDAGE